MAHGRLVIRIVVLYRGLPYGCKRYSFEHRGGAKRVPIDGEWHNPGISRCYGKVRFKRIETATEVAARMSLKTGEVLIAYQCPDCLRFHVGHATARNYWS